MRATPTCAKNFCGSHPAINSDRLYWRHCVVLSKNMDDFVNDVDRRNLRLLKAAVNCIGAVDSLHNRY